MKRFAKVLMVTASFGALGIVTSLVPQKNATGAGSAPVTVVNTPLPVTGTVNVTGNLGITGTPSVSVSNLPPISLASDTAVNVGNTSSNPVPVLDAEQPARSPVRAQCSVVVSGQSTTCILTSVDFDKRLVIEDFSADIFLDFSSQVTTLYLITAAKGVSMETYFPTFFEGTDTTFGPGNAIDHHAGGRQVRLYSDPGSAVACVVKSGRVDSTLGINCSISGFLVSTQAP